MKSSARVTKAKKAAALPDPQSVPVAQAETVEVLRTCKADMTSYGGFKWPETGPVEAPTEWWGPGAKPDNVHLGWSPGVDCGSGLHGLLAGEGDWGLLDWTLGAKALIVTVAKDLIVKSSGKVRFPRALNVRVVSSLATALCAMVAAPPVLKALVRSIFEAAGPPSGNASKLAASGNASKLAASGNASKLAASGNASKLAASGNASQLAASGYASQLAASGYASQLAASGNASQLAASGYASKLAASGYASQLAASGDASQLAASGDASKLAASGDASKLAASGNASKLAASGDASKLAASGDASIVISAGYNSTASAGPNGAIALSWHDGKRPRIIVGYVGEAGIEANVTYAVQVVAGAPKLVATE